MLNLIIAGSRDFNHYPTLVNACTEFIETFCSCGVLPTETLKSTDIISGMARGADSLGAEFGRTYCRKVIEIPADWGKYGKAAGPIRNEEMAKIADAAIVFWDGESRGTENMIDIMTRLNKPCKIVYF